MTMAYVEKWMEMQTVTLQEYSDKVNKHLQGGELSLFFCFNSQLMTSWRET